MSDGSTGDEKSTLLLRTTSIAQQVLNVSRSGPSTVASRWRQEQRSLGLCGREGNEGQRVEIMAISQTKFATTARRLQPSVDEIGIGN